MHEPLQFVGHHSQQGNTSLELSNLMQFSTSNAAVGPQLSNANGQFIIVSQSAVGEKMVLDRNVYAEPPHSDCSSKRIVDAPSSFLLPTTASANLILSKGEGGLPMVKKATDVNRNSKPNSPDTEAITPTSADGGIALQHHNDISFSALNSDTFNILSVDKKTMLCIPVDMIEPTSGSKRYLEQGASASFTFRFQLCRGYRDRGGCNHRGECSFIHSRHVLDSTLAARVKETPVHAYVVLATVNELIPHTTFPEAVALEVFDSSTQQNLMISSTMLLETRGAQAAYDKHFVDAGGIGGGQPKINGRDVLLHPQGATLMSNSNSHRSVASFPSPTLPQIRSSIALATSGNSAPARLQFCLHFDRGMCARGKECMFAHRVVVASPPPGAWILQAEPVPADSTPKRSSDGVLHHGVTNSQQLNQRGISSQELFGSYGYLPLAATAQRQQLMTMPSMSVVHDVQHSIPIAMLPQNTQQQFIFAPTQSSISPQWPAIATNMWQQGDVGLHPTSTTTFVPQQAQLPQQRQWIPHHSTTNFML